METEPDLEYGRHLLEAMRPFAESLAEGGLAKRTVRRHLDNLWLLGGEIIRDVGLYGERSVPALEKLKQSVDGYGGPYCRHLDTEEEVKSFDNTCKRLDKFLKQGNR